MTAQEWLDIRAEVHRRHALRKQAITTAQEAAVTLPQKQQDPT